MSIVLQGSTSGSCTLQEQAVAGTTVLTLPTVSGTVLTDTSPKAGNVIQVVSTTKTDTFSTTSSSYVDITGLSVTLTPTSSTSKLLIIGHVCLGTAYDVGGAIRIDVNGTAVGSAASASTRTLGHSGFGYWNIDGNVTNYSVIPAPLHFLYQLSSFASQTIKLQIINGDTSGLTIYVNRSQADDDATWMPRYVSTITVMEIAA